ncbi:hypothetical protein QO062_08770 [Fervidobacterium pennivorans subsp. carthaginiensis]|uniref:hypothetical protein n=1 Tax=Fervidobacterium pennivorans TaxID=93466 RepID=UPI00355B89AC
MDNILYLGVEFVLVVALIIVLPFPAYWIAGYEKGFGNFSLAVETFVSPDSNMSKINMIGLRGHLIYKIFESDFLTFKLFAGDPTVAYNLTNSNIEFVFSPKIGAKAELLKSFYITVFGNVITTSPYLWPGAGLFILTYF